MKTILPIRTVLRALLACALLATASSPAWAKTKREPIEKFRARAFDINRGAAANLDIVIYEWTTPEERQALLKTLAESGSEALYDALGDGMGIVGPDTFTWVQLAGLFGSGAPGYQEIASFSYTLIELAGQHFQLVTGIFISIFQLETDLVQAGPGNPISVADACEVFPGTGLQGTDMLTWLES